MLFDTERIYLQLFHFEIWRISSVLIIVNSQHPPAQQTSGPPVEARRKLSRPGRQAEPQLDKENQRQPRRVGVEVPERTAVECGDFTRTIHPELKC